MARYPEGHKQETRDRILDAAARRFKTDGLTGAGIGPVMADAGLTNGGFYAHFASKEDLICAVVRREIAAQTAALSAHPASPEGLVDALRAYLSARHRDDHAGGCPTAAMVEDIARAASAVREAYGSAMTQMVATLRAEGRVRSDLDDAAILAALGALSGVLQMSRALPDPDVAAEVLKRGLTQALATLGAEPG